MCSSAKFERTRTDLDDTHYIAVLFTEKRHGTALLCFIERHLSRDDLVIRANVLVYK